MLKKIISISLLLGLTFNALTTSAEIIAPEQKIIQHSQKLPLTGALSAQEIIDKVGIRRSAKVDTTLNEENFRLAGSTETKISHWLAVLPKQDRNKNLYIILPTQGLVMPINTVPKESRAYKNFVNGKAENFTTYLDTGAVEIPATSLRGYGQAGNKVIAGHSSYFYKKNSHYRTHFQKIIGMEKDEQIWIYEKNPKTGKFTRYVYQVTESYETDDEDVSILEPTKKKQITLFTCTPIGGVSGRWVVKAEFLAKF